MRHAILISSALLATACGEPVSNAVFEEDLEFLAALPDAEQQRVALDEEVEQADEARAAAGWCDPETRPYLLCWSYDVGGNINAHVLAMLAFVDYVRAWPPTERGPDSRVWGPYEYEPGRWIRLDMQRSGGLYTWSFSLSPAESGPWTPFFDGDHYRGETVARGVGSYTLDYAGYAAVTGEEAAGTLTVDYDTEADTELLVHFEEVLIGDLDQPLTADYWYGGDEDGGELEFSGEANWVEESDAEELFRVRTRWVDGEGGRSDATLGGGDIPDGWDDVRISQCWGRYGFGTWEWSNYDEVLTESGDPDACVFSDFAEPEHI